MTHIIRPKIGKHHLRLILVIGLLFASVVNGKSIPIEERDAVRMELQQKAQDIITAVVANNPQVQEEIDNSVGYLAGTAFSAKSLLLGGATGEGIIYDKHNRSRTYIDLNRIELGVGLGAGDYRYLVIFQERSSLLRFRRGTWKSSIGAEAEIGEQDKGSSTITNKGYKIYVLEDTGANASITLRLARVTINDELTDTGVGNASMAMSGFDKEGRQGDDAPRVWDQYLPFLAQKALDKGYDLPRPYGVSLLYAHVEQDQLLDSLKGGLNGGEVESFDFVSFDNAQSNTDSVQLKVDAWLFPFMNLYATAGHTEGEAPLDVELDGTGMLDYLDISCDRLVNNPLCGSLDGKTVVLPVNARPSGMTYSVGTILAGGWHGFFFTLPLNWTILDLDGRTTEGNVFTVTPRVGKVLDLGNYGNLAVYGGGNYLDTKLTVTGSYTFPGEKLTVDYVIDQENKDKWNGVIGANWDIDSHWSVICEYNGFFGSREAFIGSLVWRF